MDFNDFRTRQFMIPAQTDYRNSGFATQPQQADVPFRGIEIQGPLGMPQQQQPDDPFGAEFDMFDKLYNSPSPALEAYKRHIMSMPQQSQYRPGKMDRVAAALTGVSEGMRGGGGRGYAAAQGVINRPYNEALQNYQMQGQGLGQLAEIESTEQKNRMSGLNTMTEARRKAMETLSNIARDQSLNKLTEAQTEKARGELAMLGMELKQNEATGQLEVVNMRTGARTPLGQFKQTPQEASKLKVEETVASHRGTAGIDFANAKGLFDYRTPKEQAKEIAVHAANRDYDSKHPIPQATTDANRAASQYGIAFQTAVQETAMGNKDYLPFVSRDERTRAGAMKKFPKLYEKFVQDYTAKHQEILGRGGVVGGNPTGVGGGNNGIGVRMPATDNANPLFGGSVPQVTLPGNWNASPLNAPATPQTPERDAALQILREKYPDYPDSSFTDDIIQATINQMR